MGRSALLTTGLAPQTRALLLLLGVTLLWAAIEIIGVFLPDNLSPYQVVWMRYAVHLLALTVVFGPRYRSRLWRTPRPLLQLGRGLLMLGMPVCYILGVRQLPPASVWAIFWCAPLLALALAALWLREKVRWPAWLAAAGAYGGVLLLLQPPAIALSAALVLPLGMALCFALYLFASRALRKDSLLASLFYTAVGVLIPLSVRLPHFWRPLSWVGGLEMAAIGLLGLLLLCCLDKALELAAISQVAPVLLAAPLWLTAAEAVLFQTAVSFYTILGAVLIASTLLGFWIYARQQGSPAATVLPVLPVLTNQAHTSLGNRK